VPSLPNLLYYESILIEVLHEGDKNDTENPQKQTDTRRRRCTYQTGIRLQRSPAVRFLFISGRPIKEPVAWYGPIVMNTDEERETAFEAYQNGTFIRHK